MSMNANIRGAGRALARCGKTRRAGRRRPFDALRLIRALGARHAAFGILHVDAHCDLRDAYEGFEFSHASIMFNVLRDVPAVTKIAQVAVRDFSEREGGAGRLVRARRHVRRPFARGRPFPRRNVGCAVSAYRRNASAGGST